MKETNLEQVKLIATAFLHMEIRKTTSSPVIVQHPFTSHGFIGLRDKQTGAIEVVNILEDNAAFEKYKAEMEERIDKIDSISDLNLMLTNPYKLVFLKMAAAHISAADMGRYLHANWSSIEFISQDVDVSKTEIVRLLKASDRQTLMNKKEHEKLKSLSDNVEIYRGVTEQNHAQVKSLCWTLDIKQARFFANRFQTKGFVYRGTIRKADILAYFAGRSEEEIVVDFRRLTNVMLIEEIAPDGEKASIEQ